MTKKTKEQQQLEIENKRKLREKQRLQLKASNEMLEEAKQRVIEKYGEGSDSAAEYIAQITTAQDQNIERAQEILNVSEEEFYSGNYNEVNPKEAEAYYKRLETLGKSDELLHMKDVTEQLKLYEEQKNSTKAIPTTKKTQSRLSELNEKLKQLQSIPNTNDDKNKVTDTVNIIKSATENHDVSSDAIPSKNVYDERKFKVELQGTSDTFDPRDVPSYVQYDMIPLPSKGECYAHKKAYIPVAYLTAADENLITSKNLYGSGSMIDLILERKILDKSIRVADLCKGDRDAIAIWLRATAYGPDYPVIVPYKDGQIETVIDLNDIHYLDFDLKGDENGWFDYKTENGDLIKYRIFTSGDETKLFENNKQVSQVINRNSIVNNIDNVIKLSETIDTENKDDIFESLQLVKKWALTINGDFENIKDNLFNSFMTDSMLLQTMSVNGITDREYIKNYIEYMRAKEAYKYRNYINSHIPGVNLSITVPVPESMGGGSFETFLSIGETVFINV